MKKIAETALQAQGRKEGERSHEQRGWGMMAWRRRRRRRVERGLVTLKGGGDIVVELMDGQQENNLMRFSDHPQSGKCCTHEWIDGEAVVLRNGRVDAHW